MVSRGRLPLAALLLAVALAAALFLGQQGAATADPNQGPRYAGVWSDGETVWVSDWLSGDLLAIDAADNRTRVPAKDISLARGDNEAGIIAAGLWSDGETIWIVDQANDRVVAHSMSTGSIVRDKEFDLADSNSDPYGIWSDGDFFYVSDTTGQKLFAYQRNDLVVDGGSPGVYAPGWNVSLEGGVAPWGIWSDGKLLWVVDDENNKIRGYTLSDGKRRPRWDVGTWSTNPNPRGIGSDGMRFRVAEGGSEPKIHVYGIYPHVPPLLGTGNENPRDLWSDGSVMWVTDRSSAKVYAYNHVFTRYPTRAYNLDVDTGQAGNSDPTGIWVVKGKMYVADDRDGMAYQYIAATGERSRTGDLNLTGRNSSPQDMFGFSWPDGKIVPAFSVLDESNKVYVYGVLPRIRTSTIDLGFNAGSGAWSDGATTWISDGENLLAYSLTTGGSAGAAVRKPDLDIILSSANSTPVGIFAHNGVMRVVNANPPAIFNYKMRAGGL